MAEVRRLAPQDALPEDGRYILVIKRFAEDAPRTTLIELVSAVDPDSPPEMTIPVLPDGSAMDFEAAIDAARAQADSEEVEVAVYAVDRTAGRRAQEVLASGGDHTVHMETLDDTDLEEGERGSDMRDRRR